MLTYVRFYNRQREQLNIPLAVSPGGSQYVIKNIDGLGPVKADVNYSSYAGMDGGVFKSSRGAVRNIVMQIGLNPNFSTVDAYGDLRRALYNWLMPQMELEMYFYSTAGTIEPVKITGYIESFEPAIFSADPMVTVSIICPVSNFSALTYQQIDVNGLGVLSFVNPGTVESGFQFTIEGVSNASSPNTIAIPRTEKAVFPTENALNRLRYSGPMYVTPGTPIVIKIKSIKGQKAVTQAFVSSWTGNLDPTYDDAAFNGNFLGYMTQWGNVVPGQNTFTPTMSAVTTGPAKLHISYYPQYGGL